MLTNCNTWRMRIVLTIGRQLKASRASRGQGRHLALATLLMATLIIVLFFYDFHFVFNFAAPFVLDRWLALRTQLN